MGGLLRTPVRRFLHVETYQARTRGMVVVWAGTNDDRCTFFGHTVTLENDIRKILRSSSRQKGEKKCFAVSQLGEEEKKQREHSTSITP